MSFAIFVCQNETSQGARFIAIYRNKTNTNFNP